VTQARALTTRSKPAGKTPSPRAMTERTAQTKKALLDAAATLFAERGYHETGVPDIVRAAGVSQGTFYQYFSHRRDVLLALAELAHEASAARPPLRSRDFGELLRAEINWYVIESVRFRTLAKVWHDAAAYDQELAEKARAARAQRVAQFALIIKQLKAARGLDPQIAAAAIVAMIEEFIFRWLVDGDAPARSTADAVAAGHTLSELAMRALGLKQEDV
jgi:AcrR family transcriptional regulator